MDSTAASLALEFAPDVAVHQRIENQTGPPLYIVKHSVEMAFRSDHRPEMTQYFSALELGEAGLGDDLQGLAGRVRQEVEMEGHPRRSRLWISMGNSLA